MKLASACNALDVSVRLCFLVNVRKARGRSVAGGRSTGRIGVGGGVEAGFSRIAGRSGWTGVPKAGEEEGILLVTVGWKGIRGGWRCVSVVIVRPDHFSNYCYDEYMSIVGNTMKGSCV